MPANCCAHRSAPRWRYSCSLLAGQIPCSESSHISLLADCTGRHRSLHSKPPLGLSGSFRLYNHIVAITKETPQTQEQCRDYPGLDLVPLVHAS